MKRIFCFWNLLFAGLTLAPVMAPRQPGHAELDRTAGQLGAPAAMGVLARHSALLQM